MTQNDSFVFIILRADSLCFCEKLCWSLVILCLKPAIKYRGFYIWGEMVFHNKKLKDSSFSISTFDEANYYLGNSFQIGGTDRRNIGQSTSFKISSATRAVTDEKRISEKLWKIFSKKSFDADDEYF